MKDVLPGQDWKLEIDRGMQDAYAVFVCFSDRTQARTTTGIYPEALGAIEALREYPPGEVFLIPVRLSDVALPRFEIDATRRLHRLQHVDLFPPERKAENLSRLVEAIRSAPHYPR